MSNLKEKYSFVAIPDAARPLHVRLQEIMERAKYSVRDICVYRIEYPIHRNGTYNLELTFVNREIEDQTRNIAVRLNAEDITTNSDADILNFIIDGVNHAFESWYHEQ